MGNEIDVKMRTWRTWHVDKAWEHGKGTLVAETECGHGLWIRNGDTDVDLERVTEGRHGMWHVGRACGHGHGKGTLAADTECGHDKGTREAKMSWHVEMIDKESR